MSLYGDNMLVIERLLKEGYYPMDYDSSDKLIKKGKKVSFKFCITDSKNIIKRYVPYPQYERLRANQVFCSA